MRNDEGVNHITLTVLSGRESSMPVQTGWSYHNTRPQGDGFRGRGLPVPVLHAHMFLAYRGYTSEADFSAWDTTERISSITLVSMAPSYLLRMVRTFDRVVSSMFSNWTV